VNAVALAVSRGAPLGHKESIYKTKRFSDDAPLTIDYSYNWDV
jgi:hypothetical protein